MAHNPLIWSFNFLHFGWTRGNEFLQVSLLIPSRLDKAMKALDTDFLKDCGNEFAGVIDSVASGQGHEGPGHGVAMIEIEEWYRMRRPFS